MSLDDYRAFISGKFKSGHTDKIEAGEINSKLFPFQRDIVRWSLDRGRSAIFADCGMGKTAMQLEWAQHVPGRVLIAAPLAVSHQTVAEAIKFDVPGVKYLRHDDSETRIVVTNYEMLKNFDPGNFAGVVLDESSILKSYSGKVRTQLVKEWSAPRYRLACTATPAPNDYMELGSHAEFLGVTTSSEMLSAYFINDTASVGRYVLKGHAQKPFWSWMAAWATLVRKPSDLGYEDGDFVLPELHINHVQVEPEKQSDQELLFDLPAASMSERLNARKNSVEARCAAAAKIANETGGPVLVWCHLNRESELLCKLIPDAIEVKGSHSLDIKTAKLLAFTNGEARVLVSKPSICGWGMNWQHCATAIFTGLTDSYESFYQAIRRNWRFGQKREVHAHLIHASTEGAVRSNLKRKDSQMEVFSRELAGAMKGRSQRAVNFAQAFNPQPIKKPAFK